MDCFFPMAKRDGVKDQDQKSKKRVTIVNFFVIIHEFENNSFKKLLIVLFIPHTCPLGILLILK